MATHKALGRGLSALFSNTQDAARDKEPGVPKWRTEGGGNLVREISINSIRPNRHQPRTAFEAEALEELANSIKVHGVAQPLVVTETSDHGEFELVVGERRLRAAKLAGLATVPCLVKKITNQARFEVALIENLQREDLNALEEATALDNLMKEYGLTQEAVAAAIGKSRPAVANILRFLRLHDKVQDALRSGTITEGHAKCLAGVAEHAEQLRLLEKILKEKLTVRDVENLLAEKGPRKGGKGSKRGFEPLPEARKYEEDLQRLLGRRVEIQTSGKKGWIRFAFYSPWDLENLLKKLDLIEGEVQAAPQENQQQK